MIAQYHPRGMIEVTTTAPLEPCELQAMMGGELGVTMYAHESLAFIRQSATKRDIRAIADFLLRLAETGDYPE